MSDYKIRPFPRPAATPPVPVPAAAPTPPPLTPANPKVVLITDGACEPNPGPGGWGVVIRSGETVEERFGGEADTTNNRMEITAVIEGLKALQQPSEVEVISDSQYVVYTMTKGWKKKMNHDLWDALGVAMTGHTVSWTWVRGHDGHKDNERADALSLKGIEQASGR